MSEFIWPVRVYYEDTDVGGVVYHSNYLNFMERARTEWLRQFGIEQDWLLAEGIAFAVGRMEIDFIRPARFNNALQVSVKLVKKGRASLVFEQEIYKQNDPATVLCRGQVKVGCIDTHRFRPIAIPDSIKAKINHADQ